MASEPLRVLVTSDIASEGVNLHKQCHHLIHFDLPWSLITTRTAQRSHRPIWTAAPAEIRYLVYQPAEMRSPAICESSERSPKSTQRTGHWVMRVRHGPLQRVAEEEHVLTRCASAQSPIASARWRKRRRSQRLRSVGVRWPRPSGSQGIGFAALPPAVPVDAPPSLFGGDDDYLTAAVSSHTLASEGHRWETDGPVGLVRPPDDLLRRLGALPQSYLRQRNLGERLRITADAESANRSLPTQ